MQTSRSFPTTAPMMSYQQALRLAEAGKSKQKLARAYELFGRLNLGHILFKAVKTVGQTLEVKEAHVNIEVPMCSAIGTPRTMLGVAAPDCGALG